MVVSYDDEKKSAFLSLRQAQILAALEKDEMKQRKIEDDANLA